MSKTTFFCDHCNKESAMWAAWFKKRKNHYCSRPCKDAHHKILYGSGLERKEYEKLYWAKPENQARRKIKQMAAHKTRCELFGDSLKKVILARVKSRATLRGIPFDLSIDDFAVPRVCPILGFELALGDKQGGQFNSPSLDRISPSLGYVKGNVVVIYKRANTIKTDAQLHELEALVAFMKSLHQPEVGQSSFRL